MKWVRPSMGLVAVGAAIVAAISAFMATGPTKRDGSGQTSGCQFPAVYNFGDSNSDTGGRSAALRRVPSPYGNTFFGRPSGRYSDGQLIIDVLAEKLGLPHLSAYLDSIGTNFRHGANFATGGSTIRPIDGKAFEAGFSPISLDIQLMQFEQFKERTGELYNQGKSSGVPNSFPQPETFSKALYTFDIAQNDLTAGFRWSTEMQVLTSIPNITNVFALMVEKLYQNGARNFWIHNTGPIGCLPAFIIHYPPNPDNTDQNGCIKSHNEVAQEFNSQLKETVSRLRAQLPDALLVYVDIYSAKHMLISEANKHGFENPLESCCGPDGNHSLRCGMKDPSSCISWDGVHYSHAANQWVANRIMDGSFSDLPIPIAEACHKIENQKNNWGLPN